MYYGDTPPSPGVVPIPDQNLKLSFPLPPEYNDNIPGFLQTLFDQLDEVRQEKSQLWADLYPPVPIMRRTKTKPYEPPIRKEMQIRKELDEASAKEDALMAQISELKWLLRPENTPSVGEEAAK